jgi:hypothetical protein
LYGASDNQITSFGGGTEYVDGNTTTAPTGTVMLWKSAVSTLRPASSGFPLPVNIISGSSSGTEYVEDSTSTLPTGQVMLWKSGVSTLKAASSGFPLPVNIVAGSASGTQYVDGNTSTLPTGTVMLWKEAVSTLRPASSGFPLPVNIVSGSSSGTEYVEGATTTLATGQVMLWRSAVSTLTAVTTSNPLPVSTLPLTANLGTISSVATQATLGEISTTNASSVSLLSTIAARVILNSSLALQATLAEISTFQSSSVSLLSSNKLRLETISTTVNSTNTLLVQVSSNTASSNALLSTISARLAPVPTGIYTQPVPVSSNGLTPYKTLNCNNSTQQIVSTAATIYGIYFGNTSSVPVYLKIWDGVSSATFVSSTAATICLPIPANSTNFVAGNFTGGNGIGIKMSTGICIAGVLGANDGNSTAIGNSTLIVNLFYKS